MIGDVHDEYVGVGSLGPLSPHSNSSAPCEEEKLNVACVTGIAPRGPLSTRTG